MIDLTPILQAAVTLIGTIITVLVIPLIKSKTNAQQLERMQAWTRIAVSAAEQLYAESGQGEKKKAYVLAFLKQHGFTVDMATLDALIEAAVNALKNDQGFITVEGVEVG